MRPARPGWGWLGRCRRSGCAVWWRPRSWSARPEIEGRPSPRCRTAGRLLRIGELPGVRVPSEADEAARDLVRAREDARGGPDAGPAPAVQAAAESGAG